MIPPTTSPVGNPEALVGRIAEASRRFAAGEIVDLADLAETVKQVARHLDPRDPSTLNLLMALQDELQSLAEAVARQRGQLRATITDIEQARRARHAYRGQK